jgi:hypothetical protein
MSKGPSISRSRTQLATSYAPGSFFTFEGGRGCFLSVPTTLPASVLDTNPAVRQQISEQLVESINSWYQRGVSSRSSRADLPPIHIEQLLDRNLILHDLPNVNIDIFTLIEPSRVGYVPSPLNFHCHKCKLLHNYENVDDFARNHSGIENRMECLDGGKHEWRQLDVLFHHWSGNVEPLHPGRSCSCGGRDYRLHKSITGVFSDWKFECANCNTFTNLFRRDAVTRDIFAQYPGDHHTVDETTMLPISYRSTSVHYTQLERFIPHNDLEMVIKLQPDREDDLTLQLMSIYAYPTPPLDDAMIEKALTEKGVEFQYQPYAIMRKEAAQARSVGSIPLANSFENSAKNILDGFLRAGYIENVAVADPTLKSQCAVRREYARRYDPIRLSLEHAMIENKHLTGIGNRNYYDLKSPPEDVRPELASGEDGLATYKTEMNSACSIMGIERICLIRELEIVQYSYGFSRVKHVPVYESKNKPMPVRLNLYPHIERNKRPIYILSQKNEAIYVKLDQGQVISWLLANHVTIGEPLAPGQKLGARYIGQYQDFGYYLEAFRRRDTTRRNLCNMIYLLLHTISHQMIHVIAEFSGLEVGSLGECIYPADLAFVIYRSALTPDLGNISSMWRNFGASVLRQVYDPQMLQCGSGTLCEQRGGACPGCIMVPEVVCLAWNDLLSRSALAGGSKPHWDSSSHTRLTGFLEVTTGTAGVTL